MAHKTTDGGRSRVEGGIVSALNRDWHSLEAGHSETVREWADRHLVFARCNNIRDVLDAVSTQPDATLHALLAEVASSDQLAGRVIVQSLIGGLVAMAGRDPRSGVDDYLSALWCQIATYPLARRPTSIAGNLMLDTLKAVQRERRWLVRGEVATWPPGELLDELFHSAGAALQDVADDGLNLSARAMLGAARQLKVIDQGAHTLLSGVYIEGLTGTEVAQRHGSTPGSVRVRCSRAMSRIRRALPDLMELA